MLEAGTEATADAATVQVRLAVLQAAVWGADSAALAVAVFCKLALGARDDGLVVVVLGFSALSSLVVHRGLLLPGYVVQSPVCSVVHTLPCGLNGFHLSRPFALETGVSI